ncbi:hypothetical protein [Vreelandella sulfidaeris]|uniref:hypothetical protein n=1 Tax=Vreelandella sulfidaeris TaxID=115553 RepID=UPI00142D520F|nr:hypothetical protein [Halomonas sulfidaeris]
MLATRQQAQHRFFMNICPSQGVVPKPRGNYPGHLEQLFQADTGAPLLMARLS